MDDSAKFVIGIIVVVLLGLPLLGQLSKKSAVTAPASVGQQPDAATSASEPTPVYAPPPPQQAAPAVPPQAAPPPQRAQRPQPPPPPMNLSNTAWTLKHPQFGDITIELFPGGQGVAQGTNLPTQIDGTWVQNGNSLTFSAMGRTISAQLKGDQLVANGMAAQRLR